MFTSPINFLIDYLFLEILSAPTADSLKLDELETFNRLADVISSIGTSAVSGARTMGRRVGRRLSQVAQAAGVMNISSVSKVEKAGVQRTLSIPPATLEAQIIASRTSSQLISQLRQENEAFAMSRDLERSASTAFQKRVILNQKRTESVKGMPKQSLRPVEKKTIDDLFTHLSVDIIEQRKVLPISEQELFDEQWG
jgi:hypothetical protein